MSKRLELWVCGGGPGVPIFYGYGYWTGPDGDLLCVVDSIDDVERVEDTLSPILWFKVMAFLCFFLKRLQIKVERLRKEVKKL